MLFFTRPKREVTRSETRSSAEKLRLCRRDRETARPQVPVATVSWGIIPGPSVLLWWLLMLWELPCSPIYSCRVRSGEGDH